VTGGDVQIGEGSVIGLGAVIRDGVEIAAGSFIGAGAVVVRDTEPGGVYVGSPARPTGKTALEATCG
jgi:acetyltransferase-like isoleucine patch superfamily enzyme